MQTSYFGKYKEENGVAICRKIPSYYKGDIYRDVAPSHKILSKFRQSGNIKIYVQDYYDEVLSKLDANEVYDRLKGKVCLCFEKSDEFCHRHILSNWIEESTGHKITEWKCNDPGSVFDIRPFLSGLVRDNDHLQNVSFGFELVTELYVGNLNVKPGENISLSYSLLTGRYIANGEVSHIDTINGDPEAIWITSESGLKRIRLKTIEQMNVSGKKIDIEKGYNLKTKIVTDIESLLEGDTVIVSSRSNNIDIGILSFKHYKNSSDIDVNIIINPSNLKTLNPNDYRIKLYVP